MLGTTLTPATARYANACLVRSQPEILDNFWGCRADLHVCRLCAFYDPSVSRSCREPIADEVGDKERANFCGYFTALPGAHKPADSSAADAARAKLSDLFGDGDVKADRADGKSEGDAARRDLERLFGIDDKKG